jgi:hypothetical protein
MKKTIFLLLVFLAFAGIANAGAVDEVKNARNLIGLRCDEIPGVIENAGFKDLAIKWIESEVQGVKKVLLRIQARKEVESETLFASYGWQSQYEWIVKDHAVTPANKLTKEWMEGKINYGK